MCKLLKNFGNFQDHNSTSLRTAQQKKPLSHSLQFPGQSSVPTQGSKIYFAADLALAFAVLFGALAGFSAGFSGSSPSGVAVSALRLV